MQNSFQKLSNMFIFAPCRIYLHQYPYGQYSYVKKLLSSCSINQFYGLFHFFCSNRNCIVSFIYYILTFPQNSFCNFLPVFRKTRLIFFILSIHILPKVFVLNVSCLLPAHIRILINLPSNLIEQLFES